MSKIVFNDGTEIQDAVIDNLMSPLKIICEIPGSNLLETLTMFSDTNKTCKIEYYNMNLYKTTYINYTVVNDISVLHDTNQIRVVLSGKNDSEIINNYTLPDEYVPGALAEEIFSNQREEQQNNEH